MVVIHLLARRHSRKLSPCQKLCIFLTITIILLIIVAVTIVLTLLLPRSSMKGTGLRFYFSVPASMCFADQQRSPAVLRWNSTGITVAGYGSGGNYSDPLSQPFGFALDASGTLFITEFSGHRIRKWIQGAPTGTVIAGAVIPTPSNAANRFDQPADIVLEWNGDMYIADRQNNRIQFWPNGATSGITIAGENNLTDYFLTQLFLCRFWIELQCFSQLFSRHFQRFCVE